MRSLFDWCACVRAGAEAAGEWPLQAAGRLALAAHRHDQDDLHYGSLTHPGGIVWSAIAACALERDVTLGEAIGAGAYGYELIVRLAEAAGPAHRLRWHVTATAGTVGAAGAAARLLAGDTEVETDAVAHAISIAGGAAHAIIERSATRFLHRAHAVTSGLACAHAACAGKPGGRLILDDERNPFVLASAGPLTATRPSAALEETGFRLRPATGFAHSALDAALALAPLDGIEHVRVGVSATAAMLASNPDPRGEDEAWWSIEHGVASTLGVEIDRVEVRATAEDWAATVEVRLRDGSTATASATAPRGHPDRPASDADLRAKWTRLTGADGAEPFRRIGSADDTDSFRVVIGDLIGVEFWNRFQ